MFSFLSFCYKLKSLYIGLALVISYNHRCIHWKVLSALWAQHSVWRIWRRDRKPTTWSSKSLSSLWSGSGCILGWFHSPADIEAPTPIPPLHTNSSIQAVLVRCPRPTTHSLSQHCLPRACLLHRVMWQIVWVVPPHTPLPEYSIEIRLSTRSVLAEEVEQKLHVSYQERIVSVHFRLPWAQAVTGVWSQILIKRTKVVMGRRPSQGTTNMMSYM